MKYQYVGLINKFAHTSPSKRKELQPIWIDSYAFTLRRLCKTGLLSNICIFVNLKSSLIGNKLRF